MNYAVCRPTLVFWIQRSIGHTANTKQDTLLWSTNAVTHCLVNVIVRSNRKMKSWYWEAWKAIWHWCVGDWIRVQRAQIFKTAQFFRLSIVFCSYAWKMDQM